jgi:hypothetical protein
MFWCLDKLAPAVAAEQAQSLWKDEGLPYCIYSILTRLGMAAALGKSNCSPPFGKITLDTVTAESVHGGA